MRVGGKASAGVRFGVNTRQVARECTCWDPRPRCPATGLPRLGSFRLPKRVDGQRPLTHAALASSRPGGAGGVPSRQGTPRGRGKGVSASPPDAWTGRLGGGAGRRRPFPRSPAGPVMAMGFLPCSRVGLLTWALLLFLSCGSHGDCPAPKMPPHAKLDGELKETYPVGATLKFTCIPEYTFIPGSNSSIECLADSTWSTIPTFCKIRKCKPPDFENGRIESSGEGSLGVLDLGQEVTFICDEGYRLIGITTARCTLYGNNTVNWDKTPPYCERYCPAPETPPHAKLDSVLNETYPVGATLKFTCIPGYTFIPGSKSSIECLEDSTWSTIPTFCTIRKCKLPHLENGRVESSSEESSGDVEFGQEITFICNEGYRLLGTTMARCSLYPGNTVNWDKTPPYCEHIPCERPPSIDNGSHNGDAYSDHYTVGTVVRYTCNKDFTLIGDRDLRCIIAEDGINGKWNKPSPVCKVVKCTRPEIENGKLSSGFQPSYEYEHRLQFECNVGYTVLGSNVIQCIANSTWYPDPKCIKKPTTTPFPVPPGRNETSRTTPGPGATVSTVDPGNTPRPGATVSTVTPGTTPRPSTTVSTVTPDPGSATVAVGKLSLIVALLILIM